MQTLVFKLLTRWQNNKVRTLSQQCVSVETSVALSQKRLQTQQGLSLDLQTTMLQAMAGYLGKRETLGRESFVVHIHRDGQKLSEQQGHLKKSPITPTLTVSSKQHQVGPGIPLRQPLQESDPIPAKLLARSVRCSAVIFWQSRCTQFQA